MGGMPGKYAPCSVSIQVLTVRASGSTGESVGMEVSYGVKYGPLVSPTDTWLRKYATPDGWVRTTCASPSVTLQPAWVVGTQRMLTKLSRSLFTQFTGTIR